MKKALPVLLFLSIMLTGCSSSNNVETVETSSNVTSETVEETEPFIPTEFEVFINAVAKKDGDSVKFEIETNMPDKTELWVTLQRRDENTSYYEQSNAIVTAGKAESKAFSDNGKELQGDYDLMISTGDASTQVAEVRRIIGEEGEYMIGPIVIKAASGKNALSTIFSFSASDCSLTPSDDFQHTSYENYDEGENNSSNSIESKVKKKVQKYIDDNYTYTKIDSVVVNENLGTDNDGDYIALVYLTWSQKNSGKTSKEMLDLYSSDMAARMYDDIPEIQELAIFWTVPNLNDGSAKISFERSDNGMKYTDEIFDSNFD